MNYNKDLLIKWLYSKKNINSALVLKIMNEKNEIDKKNIHDILPEILVEFDDNILFELKKTLISECSKAKEKDFDFRLIYIKSKLGMLSTHELQNITLSILKQIKYDILNETIDIELLYKILYISDKTNSENSPILVDIISGLMLYFSRKYMLFEYSVCFYAATKLKKYFEYNFFNEIKNFLGYVQNDVGYFGYNNPFVPTNKNNDNLLILTSLYITLADKNLNY